MTGKPPIADVFAALGITAEEIRKLDLGDDRLCGAREIARHRNEAIEKTRYLLKCGRIPHYKEGALIVSSKLALNKAHLIALLGQQTGAEAA
jgi:hypothetical protein